MWAGFKIGPLFFQAMQVKEPGCLGEASPAETGLGWGSCGLSAGLYGWFSFGCCFLVHTRLLHISRPQRSGLEGGT